MRRFLSASILALAALAAAAPAAAEGVALAMNQAEKVRLRGSATDVVIGNPEVADVALIDPRTVVVTGKSQGTTRMVIFDAARRVLFDGPVSVGAPYGQVAVVRGAQEQTFVCVGACSPVANR
jgi:Flp pilus assembly secretin CpaC